MSLAIAIEMLPLLVLVGPLLSPRAARAELPTAPIATAPRTLQLGDECDRSRDCDEHIDNAECFLGFCQCKSFYARLNETSCLHATLLGSRCEVDEQCSMRVANSSCRQGICACNDGSLPYHTHTCLPPARVGQVCYSDAHCRLWERESHCDFLIRDLFGWCQCTAPLRRDGETCRADGFGPGAAHQPPQLRAGKPTLAAQLRAEGPVPAPALPLALVDDEAVVVLAESAELARPVGAQPAPQPAQEPEARTLGWPCSADAECRLADPGSRCLEGLCECLDTQGRWDNGTACSASKTGCAPGSFQCRSEPRCISWFFVCDGRRDCEDGSDEECADAARCPAQAFKCGPSPAGCVSRAALCDGTSDCPRGEDELGCTDRRRCPEGAFRCNNGQCLPAYEFCNAVVSCRDGSDEPRAACRTRNRGRLSGRHCPFRCANGRCRSDAITCSGRDGCGDNSDELHCRVCKCPPIP